MMDAKDQDAYLKELLTVGAPQGGAAPDTGSQAAVSEPSNDGAGTGDGGVTREGWNEAAEGSGSRKGGARVQPPSWRRTYVAAPVTTNGVRRLPGDAKKAKAVHYELVCLNVAKYPNATAVLVRMFVEFSVEYYIERKNMSCRASDLAEQVKKVADHMVQEGAITTQREANGYKQHTSKETISTMTLHGFVHQEFIPDQQTVNTFWDNMLPFLRKCWHD